MKQYIVAIILALLTLPCLGQDFNITELQAKAESGDALSILRLAQCYKYGFKVPKDSLKVIELSQKAIKVSKKAAKKGDPEAQLNMGRALIELKTHEDSLAAFEWMTKSAEQGNSYAMNNIGMFYLSGDIVKKDEALGIEWLKRAALAKLDLAQFTLGKNYYYGNRPFPEDNDKAVFWLSEAADQGFIQAECLLAKCYQNGYGVNKDYEKAINLLKRAEAQYTISPTYFHGINLFQYLYGEKATMIDCYALLGIFYDNGFGCIQDNGKAAEFYKKAADGGNANAMNNLGVMFANGKGVEKSLEKAVELYTKSANAGNAVAMTNLASCYEDGTVVSKDDSKALYWYNKAAEQDSTIGQQSLGTYYIKHGDTIKAIPCYEIAAEKEDSVAKFYLGKIYYLGTGTPQNYHKAFTLFKSLDDKDFPEIDDYLGNMYQFGRGVDIDKAEAVKYYKKAAASGYPYSMCRLALLYLDGEVVPKDEEKAAELVKKAADSGYVYALSILGSLYCDGKGVPEDKEKGIQIIWDAYKKGDTNAIGLINQLSNNPDYEWAIKRVLPFTVIDSVEYYVRFKEDKNGDDGNGYIEANKDGKVIGQYYPKGMFFEVFDTKLYNNHLYIIGGTGATAGGMAAVMNTNVYCIDLDYDNLECIEESCAEAKFVGNTIRINNAEFTNFDQVMNNPNKYCMADLRTRDHWRTYYMK